LTLLTNLKLIDKYDTYKQLLTKPFELTMENLDSKLEEFTDRLLKREEQDRKDSMSQYRSVLNSIIKDQLLQPEKATS